MKNLDTVKVLLVDDSISDEYLLLNGFKKLWYTYEGKVMAIRRQYLPSAISRDAVILLMLSDDGAIHNVGLGWG